MVRFRSTSELVKELEFRPATLTILIGIFSLRLDLSKLALEREWFFTVKVFQASAELSTEMVGHDECFFLMFFHAKPVEIESYGFLFFGAG